MVLLLAAVLLGSAAIVYPEPALLASQAASCRSRLGDSGRMASPGHGPGAAGALVSPTRQLNPREGFHLVVAAGAGRSRGRRAGGRRRNPPCRFPIPAHETSTVVHSGAGVGAVVRGQRARSARCRRKRPRQAKAYPPRSDTAGSTCRKTESRTGPTATCATCRWTGGIRASDGRRRSASPGLPPPLRCGPSAPPSTPPGWSAIR